MKKHLLLALSVLALIGIVAAQSPFPWSVMQVFSPPGPCANNAPPEQYNGTLYTCNGTNYAAVSGGGVINSTINGTVLNSTLGAIAWYQQNAPVVNGSVINGLVWASSGTKPVAANSTNVQSVIGAGVYDASGAAGGRAAWPSLVGIPYWTSGTAWAGAYNATNQIPANYISILNQPTTGTSGGLSGSPSITVSGVTDTGCSTAGLATTTSGGVFGCQSYAAALSNLTSTEVNTALGYTPLNPANNLADVLSISTALSNLGGVPTSRTINGHALSSNVTISASDLTTGTLPHAQLPTLLSGDIPNNAANTSGTAANLSGTPAIPNGAMAWTQSPGDTTAKLATDAFVAAAISASGGGTVTAASNTTFANDFALWSNTSGTIIKDAGFGPPVGTIVGTTDSQTLTNKNMTSSTNSWPTFNQSTTGQAGTALAAAATPSVCALGQVPNGILANFNATGCTTYLTPTGSGASLTGITPAQVGAIQEVAKGTITLSSSALTTSGSSQCATFIAAASGALTTDVLNMSANGDITGVSGYAPTGQTVQIYPPWLTSNTANVKICNPSSNTSTITTGTIVLNWNVTR